MSPRKPSADLRTIPGGLARQAPAPISAEVRAALEKAVVSGLMIDPERAPYLRLSDAHFATLQYRRLYSLVREMVTSGKVVSVPAIADEYARAHGVGQEPGEAAAFVAELHDVAEFEATAGLLPHHALRLRRISLEERERAVGERIAREGLADADKAELAEIELELREIEGDLSDHGRPTVAGRFRESESAVASWFGSDGELIEPPERPYVIGNLLPEGVPWLLVAQGGTGKGFLELLFAIHVATGLELGERFPIARPRGVLLVSREDDARELHRRAVRILQALHPAGVPEEVRSLLESNLHPVDLFGVRGARLGEDLAAHVCRRAERARAALVMLDPLGKLLPLDEGTGAPINLNSQEGAGVVHDWLDAIVQRSGCSVGMAHHTRKAERKGGGAGGPPSAEDATGSLQLVDLARLVLTAGPVTAEEGSSMGLPFHPPGYVEVRDPKVNYGAKLSAPLVFKRVTGGALVPVDAIDRASINQERALRVLEDAGVPMTREEWTAAVKEQHEIGENAQKSIRKALAARGLLLQEAGEDGSRKPRFRPSDTAALRDRSRFDGRI